MIGTIAGDIIGSRYEFKNIKTKNFRLFNGYKSPTDDTAMSLAVGMAILMSKRDWTKLYDYTVRCMQAIGCDYPDAGFGRRFKRWLYEENPKPYNSWGNGSAMRVSACGWAANSLEEALSLAEITSSTTHNHPEGIKGAQAVAAAIYLARNGKSRDEIRRYIEDNYYKIDFTIDEIRPTYTFDVSCQGSVPQAFESFFEAVDYEDTVRNAISIGGDSDTIAAIAGSIAEAYFGVPEKIANEARSFLDSIQLEYLDRFESVYGNGVIKETESDDNGFGDAVKGAVIGLAIGDALGVPVEFEGRNRRKADPVAEMREFGTHYQPKGTWSDDTSMTMCVLDSFTKKGLNYEDQMERFKAWYDKAAYTAHNHVFDIGGTTANAIERAIKGTPALKCGDTGERSCGNGSLMRMVPVALYIYKEYGPVFDEKTALIIHSCSMLTHAHKRCQMACGIYCSVILSMLGRGDLRSAVKSGIATALRYYAGKEEFESIFNDFASLEIIEDFDENDISGNGYVLHTLQAALWCLLTTKSYSECVLKAVNLGDDTDTTGTVAGGLAGLWYGLKGIPAAWIQTLAQNDWILEMCEKFTKS